MRVSILSLFSVFVACLLVIYSDCTAAIAPHDQADEVRLDAEASLRYIQQTEENRQPVAGRVRLTLDDAVIWKYFRYPTFRGRVDTLLDSGAQITSDVERLDLSGMDVVDIRILARLEHLQWLNLTDTQVQNIEPLAGLVKLEWLDLSRTQVQDIEPLAGLVNLEWLFLSHTQVQNIEPLARLEKLRGHINWDGPRLQISPHAQIVSVLPEGEDQCICAVCLEPINNLPECLKVCGTNHCHRSCLEQWKASCSASSHDFTCPLCRAEMVEVPAPARIGQI